MTERQETALFYLTVGAVIVGCILFVAYLQWSAIVPRSLR